MINESVQLVVVGMNHKTSTVSQREKFQINRKEIQPSVNYLKSLDSVEGTVIVSTCNRLEFYLTLKSGTDPFSIISDFYCRKGIITVPVNKKLFYSYKDINAARHLFSVAAGLDSLVTGEYQIQGQVKDAYSLACSEKAADKILHKLFHAAFRVGKTVRTKTKIGSCNQSLSGVAFKVLKEKLRKEDVITIVGVNQNTKIIADKLSKAGFNHLLFVNRTLHKAEELADKYNGVAFSLDYIEEPLISSKCVFSCTGAPGFIINSDLINKIYSKNKLPKLLIDMAVPRDINTQGLVRDIEVIDLEGLKKYLDKEKEELVHDIPEAERIIANEADIFEVWNEWQADDSICVYREKMEKIRMQLLDDLRLNASENEFELLEKFSHSLVHRMETIIIEAVKTMHTI